MSLGSEARIEQEIAECLFWDNVQIRARNREWLTGKRINEMTVSHIKNCMKQLEREPDSDLYEIYYSMFQKELLTRNQES